MLHRDAHTRDGEFQNDIGVWFSYKLIKEVERDAYTPKDANCKIDMSDGSFRFAKLLKTCVWVYVDEDENAEYVRERWGVKACSTYLK